MIKVFLNSSGGEPFITAGTSAQYFRGDKSWQTLNQEAVPGLTTADSPTFAGGVFNGNAGIGTTSFGTGLTKGLAIGSGTPATTSPANVVQVWVEDTGGVADKAGLHIRTEDGTSHVFGDKVGIGTVTPAATLHVIAPTVDGVNGTASFFTPTAAAGQVCFILVGKAAALAQSGSIGFYHTAVDADSGVTITNYGDNPGPQGLFFRKGGNAGIGTITPTEKLHIVGGTIRTYNTSDTYLRMDRSLTTKDNAITWVDAGADKWYMGALPSAGPATAWQLYSTGKTGGAGVVMAVLAGGAVGFGTNAPTSPLQVVGLPVYANNAAAAAGGLTAGAFYRTGADPDPVCVVH